MRLCNCLINAKLLKKKNCKFRKSAFYGKTIGWGCRIGIVPVTRKYVSVAAHPFALGTTNGMQGNTNKYKYKYENTSKRVSVAVHPFTPSQTSCICIEIQMDTNTKKVCIKSNYVSIHKGNVKIQIIVIFLLFKKASFLFAFWKV